MISLHCLSKKMSLGATRKSVLTTLIDFQAGYVDYLAQCFYSFTQPFIGKRSLSKLKSFVDSLNQSQNISCFLQDLYFVSFVRKFKMKLFELTKNT